MFKIKRCDQQKVCISALNYNHETLIFQKNMNSYPCSDILLPNLHPVMFTIFNEASNPLNSFASAHIRQTNTIIIIVLMCNMDKCFFFAPRLPSHHYCRSPNDNFRHNTN